MPSPWNKNVTPESVNLQDVMLEELTKNAQEKENRKFGVFAFSTHEEMNISEMVSQHNEQLKSDEEFAKMLQQQYDKGYCDILYKDKLSSASGVLPTFLYDKQSSLNLDLDSDNDELEDIRDTNEWDKFGTVLKEFDPIPAHNCKCNNGNLVKENTTFNNQTICKIISFPWSYVPGASMEKKKGVPENVSKRRYGIDDTTKRILYKMIKIQLLKQIHGLISVGKDALILQATNPECPKGLLPTNCAIKIFKTTLGKCRRKDKFTTDDYRLKGMWKRSGALNIQKVACRWAQQEMHILQRLQRAGIPCPEVITLKRNILVMSYLNSDTSNKPAPKLRDAKIDLMQMTNAYKQVVHYMKVMYTECNLIHGNLSATNILWYNNKCYIIAVRQCVRRTHKEALALLYDDCERICKFFTNKSVPDVSTHEELFNDITGCDPRKRFIWADYQKALEIKSDAEIKPNIQTK